MLLTKALTALAFASSSANALLEGWWHDEEVNYLLYGPKDTNPSKRRWEGETCNYAIRLLRSKIGEKQKSYKLDKIKEIEKCKKDLLKLKNKLIKEDGGNKMALGQYLAKEIDDGNKFWNTNVNASNGEWVVIEGRGVVIDRQLSAPAFAGWMLSDAADAANNAANAEHYFKVSEVQPSGATLSNILEGWGGVTTNFTIPSFVPRNLVPTGAYPMLAPMPEFGIQAVGSKDLKADAGGKRFGVLHIAVRDVADVGAEFDDARFNGKKGVDIFANVWAPKSLTEKHLEDERTHIIIEIINLSLQAIKDLALAQ